ncbi:HNH endonuclease, partial [uncultured Clostridium sp.]|uniref:HNH endonuclease n=1 Tax=uncultured Clostridium sp. TaxID=59620 RepID=UPI0025FEC669
YVDNSYTDEFYEATYNKGRIAILLYKDEVSYISFSEKEIGGRNSSIQSVPTAFNLYYNNKNSNKKLYYYFLNPSGNAETDYLIFIYRLMSTIGFEFLNAEKTLQQKINSFNSIEDIIHTRRINKKKNSSNNSTYITKSKLTHVEIYGKTYGANKYESTLICYAISKLAPQQYKVTLYEVCDKDLRELPKSCLDVLMDMGVIKVVPTDIFLEKKAFENNNSLRSPRFIYNLFDKYGEKKCALCNCKIPELIQGAHIWPVASIKNDQSINIDKKVSYAIDGENGIWLCENHHKMFDENLIKINPQGKVLIDSTLETQHKEYIKEITIQKEISQEYITEKFANYLSKRYK